MGAAGVAETSTVGTVEVEVVGTIEKGAEVVARIGYGCGKSSHSHAYCNS